MVVVENPPTVDEEGKLVSLLAGLREPPPPPFSRLCLRTAAGLKHGRRRCGPEQRQGLAAVARRGACANGNILQCWYILLCAVSLCCGHCPRHRLWLCALRLSCGLLRRLN